MYYAIKLYARACVHICGYVYCTYYYYVLGVQYMYYVLCSLWIHTHTHTIKTLIRLVYVYLYIHAYTLGYLYVHKIKCAYKYYTMLITHRTSHLYTDIIYVHKHYWCLEHGICLHFVNSPTPLSPLKIFFLAFCKV